jgi:hypothetical protein
LCFHLQPDSYDTDSLIGVLEQLAGFYAGHKVVLLWDGLSSHWSYMDLPPGGLCWRIYEPRDLVIC